MAPPDDQAIPFLNESLRFEYVEGDVSYIDEPHDTGWRELPCAVCAAVNAARLDGGHAVGAVFPLSLADLAKALGLREDTAKGKLRLVGRAGFVNLHAIGGGGIRPVSLPQSTIAELGLEP